jgi:hypothetical protein
MRRLASLRAQRQAVSIKCLLRWWRTDPASLSMR